MLKDNSRSVIKFGIFIIFLIAFAVMSVTIDVETDIAKVNNFIDSFGWWSPAAFAVVFLVVTTFIASATFMTLSAAVLFSPAKALAVVWISSVLASAVQFLLARYLARDYVTRKVQTYSYASKVKKFVDGYGTLAVALSRLIPVIPFNILNFTFGTLNISFLRYIIWSSIFMLPSAIVYVYGARSVLGFLAGADIPVITVLFVSAGIIFMVLGGYLVKRCFFSDS